MPLIECSLQWNLVLSPQPLQSGHHKQTSKVPRQHRTSAQVLLKSIQKHWFIFKAPYFNNTTLGYNPRNNIPLSFSRLPLIFPHAPRRDREAIPTFAEQPTPINQTHHYPRMHIYSEYL